MTLPLFYMVNPASKVCKIIPRMSERPITNNIKSSKNQSTTKLIKSMETKITNCIAAEKAVRDVMYGLDHEEVWGLFLRNDNTVISREMLSKGTLTQTSIDNRTVIKRALMNNANAVIILHNHPSGNPKPSPADIRVTERMKKACDLMDVRLLDHIILAGESFFSFSEERTYNR